MRNIIVTGASSGIGKAIAKRLASEGNNVCLVARNKAKLEEVANIINDQEKGKAYVFPTDVSVREEVEKMVKDVQELVGTVDIYVNNAGVMVNKTVRSGEVDDWDKMIDVNIKGVLYGINATLSDMIANESGHIVNISSVSGFEVTRNSTVYSATKFAVRAISQGLEKELAHTGVKVTNISPGMVATPLTDRSTTPNRTPLNPDDIAQAISYAINQPKDVNVNEVTVRPV